MRNKLIAVTATALAVLAGCAPPPSPPPQIAQPEPEIEVITLQNEFNADEARALLAKGNNTIKGSALIRQQGGGVVTCAGQEVDLLPNTAYARERISHIYGNVTKGVSWFQEQALEYWEFDHTAPEYRDLQKITVCDAQGYFKFTNVADGSFFVITDISWSTSGSTNWSEWEGGFLMQRVDIRNGETREIVLAP
ncbi:MAG: hypothetical protein MPL62_16060 [Alphaproteobacteria bacterium]|nr:hypothetical protein [Alphaproteobacteria bacterium]